MTDRSEALALLRRLLNEEDAEFRDGQWEAIDALVNRREQLFLVQRTGWGKSAVYFVATRMLRDRGFGATLIVSPLLALMRNQVSAAERMGVRALTINSTNRSEWPGLRRAVCVCHSGSSPGGHCPVGGRCSGLEMDANGHRGAPPASRVRGGVAVRTLDGKRGGLK